MSFEGYWQIICANGHSDIEPYDYAGDSPEWICHCGAKEVWRNRVDDTNCDNQGFIELEQLTPPKIETCPTCGHQEVVEKAIYKVPKRR